MNRAHYDPMDNFGPEDDDPGAAFITHNVDDTVTIKVRSPGDRVFSEVEMPLDEWIKLRSVGGPAATPAYPTWTVRKAKEPDDNDGYPADNQFEVLCPDGVWKGCVAVDVDDARDCIQKQWAEEQPVPPPAAAPARGFIQEHLERSLSEYDKTIDRATDDGALSETGREMIFQSCRVSKSAVRAFAERLQTYAALAAPQAQERDPADIWEDYCAEVPNSDDRSPQGAMAFALSLVTRPDHRGDGQ